MNFGLKDFFMGVVHLFVIFLPGSLLFLTLLVAFPEIINVVKPLPISGAGATLLFIGVSYFLGHLVSLLASAIEDKVWSLLWKKPKTKKGQETKKRPWVEKIKAKKDKWEGGKALRTRALRICKRELKGNRIDNNSVRRWAQHLVRHRDAGLRAEIDSKDADRRFFRNIRWVLIAPLILAATALSKDKITWAEFLVLVVITTLACLRFYDQNWKFTKLVFESLIVLDSTAKK